MSLLIGAEARLRAGEQLVRRALDEAANHVWPALVLHAMEGRHELVGGVEGQRRDARILLAGGHRVDAALGRQHHQSALGRIAYQRAVLRHRVRGERHRQQVRLQIGIGQAADARDLSRPCRSRSR